MFFASTLTLQHCQPEQHLLIRKPKSLLFYPDTQPSVLPGSSVLAPAHPCTSPATDGCSSSRLGKYRRPSSSTCIGALGTGELPGQRQCSTGLSCNILGQHRTLQQNNLDLTTRLLPLPAPLSADPVWIVVDDNSRPPSVATNLHFLSFLSPPSSLFPKILILKAISTGEPYSFSLTSVLSTHPIPSARLARFGLDTFCFARTFVTSAFSTCLYLARNPRPLLIRLSLLSLGLDPLEKNFT